MARKKDDITETKDAEEASDVIVPSEVTVENPANPETNEDGKPDTDNAEKASGVIVPSEVTVENPANPETNSETKRPANPSKDPIDPPSINEKVEVVDDGEPKEREPDTERVKFSRDMRFPIDVTIPMRVLVEIGGTERTVTLESKEQKLHPAIVNWMKSDHRWKKMFA